MAAIYLLHLDAKIAGHAGHYLGYAKQDLDSRLAEHAAGAGARLTQVALERGIGWELVRTWTGAAATRTEERRLKRIHGSRLCGICNPGNHRGRLRTKGDR
jgi:predicted GIY-YIG superfamily endonuclease